MPTDPIPDLVTAMAIHLGRPVTPADVAMVGLLVLAADPNMAGVTIQITSRDGLHTALLSNGSGAHPLTAGVYRRASSVLDTVAEWIVDTRDELSDEATPHEIRDALRASASVLVEVLIDLDLSDLFDTPEAP